MMPKKKFVGSRYCKNPVCQLVHFGSYDPEYCSEACLELHGEEMGKFQPADDDME